jgi:hypothetical protein
MPQDTTLTLSIAGVVVENGKNKVFLVLMPLRTFGFMRKLRWMSSWMDMLMSFTNMQI